MSTENLRTELVQIAAIAVAIVQDLDYGDTSLESEPTNDYYPEVEYRLEAVLLSVQLERESQEAKWGPQHHTPEEWLAILAEEVGEAADEVDVSFVESGKAWDMKDALIVAERYARAFLKERFGPDPK